MTIKLRLFTITCDSLSLRLSYMVVIRQNLRSNEVHSIGEILRVRGFSDRISRDSILEE